MRRPRRVSGNASRARDALPPGIEAEDRNGRPDQREADEPSQGLVYFHRELSNGTFENSLVTTGIRRPGDEANTYTSQDGLITFVLDETTLSITLDSLLSEHTITLEDYRPGDLNIHLLEISDEAGILSGTEFNDRIEFTRRGEPAGRRRVRPRGGHGPAGRFL